MPYGDGGEGWRCRFPPLCGFFSAEDDFFPCLALCLSLIHISVLGKEDAPCDHKYDVTGSLCENNDKFAVDRMLPKIDMGDYLYIHDTGAHGYAMGYNYNGKLKSAEVLLKEDGSFQMIRRAETPQDYFATFDCFDIIKGLIR